MIYTTKENLCQEPIVITVVDMTFISLYDKFIGFIMSIFSSYKKIFLLGFIIVILIAIPLSVYIAQQRQQTKSKASASTTLSFEPASQTINAGDTLTLNIVLDPGTGATANQVSFVKLSINFDPKKFTTITKTATDESLMPNTTGNNNLTTIVDDAVYDNTTGKASISLSVGADPTKIVTERTAIAILKLKAIAETTPITTDVIFDSANLQVLSIASGDQTSENVVKISSLIPATVTINPAADPGNPTVTPTETPTPAAPTGTSPVSAGAAPVCASLSVDRSTTGAAPYSLTFTVTGNDSDGTINKATFNFGDGPIQDVITGGGIGTNSINTQISHTYNNAGTYAAYVILTDNNSNLSTQQASCTKTITVNSAQAGSGSGTLAGTVPTQNVTQPLPAQTLPPTGPGEKIVGFGVLGTILAIVGGILFISL